MGHRAHGRHAIPGQAETAPPTPAGPWLPSGGGVRVAGLDIVGGLLYVGPSLPAPSGSPVDPALIDPSLPADLRRPDWDGRGLGHRISYSEIPSPSRAAYLTWLADGRRHPLVPIGYVFLYFYGLERRVLHDLRLDRSTAAGELPAIHEEVRRLLRLYPGDASFTRYATAFEELLAALRAPHASGSPFALRARLGELAARGRPVPADSALAWVRAHPDHHPHLAETGCPREFEALFRLRYAARHGDGLLVRPGRRELALDYRPASTGFAPATRLPLPGVPDVLTLPVPGRKLLALAEECASELEPYSRFLGRLPNGRQTVQGQALLPPELLDLGTGGAGRAVRWARGRLGHEPATLVPAGEFTALLSTPSPAKKDVVALARILGRAGIGIEPDPRLGGPLPVSGSMALFAAPDGPTAAASDAYRAATVLLRLAVAVRAAELPPVADHLERSLHLTEGEAARLRAHLAWLLAAETRPGGLARRIEGIDRARRVYVAEFLRDVLAADGHLSPAEATVLTRIHELLGLDPAAVPPASTASGRPGEEPGPAVPPADQVPGEAVSAVGEMVGAGSPEPPGVPQPLDAGVLAAKLAGSARVDALLGPLFDDGEPAPYLPAPAVAPVAGLDGRHSGLVRALPAAGPLSRGRFETLAAAWRLLPDGAMDRVNEAAYETAGEPLLDGDDPIVVNRRLLEEMLA